VPEAHISRSKSDTFYKDPHTVLRTHTSAHQQSLMREGNKAFLATGDCYRRDEIDSSHYPVFHQMEGVFVFDPTTAVANKDGTRGADEAKVMAHLQDTLEGLVHHIFAKELKTRWVDAYFPFTHPSAELEVYFNGDWLEVLGCGVMQPSILDGSNLPDHTGWAFGIGLERLAMALFGIPDIRLFWSTDERFLGQFKAGEIVEFQEFSKYPLCYKDVSFWEPPGFHENDFCANVRDVAGDLVEKVELIDQFTHPKTEKTSLCFRIDYRSMERSLTNEEVDEIQEHLRNKLIVDGYELR
jgi:phenylalanyl-tRNA synthetase alpha chain